MVTPALPARSGCGADHKPVQAPTAEAHHCPTFPQPHPTAKRPRSPETLGCRENYLPAPWVPRGDRVQGPRPGLCRQGGTEDEGQVPPSLRALRTVTRELQAGSRRKMGSRAQDKGNFYSFKKMHQQVVRRSTLARQVPCPKQGSEMKPGLTRAWEKLRGSLWHSGRARPAQRWNFVLLAPGTARSCSRARRQVSRWACLSPPEQSGRGWWQKAPCRRSSECDSQIHSPESDPQPPVNMRTGS